MAPTRKAGGSGKVGKKFASVDCMLNLIDAVNQTEDARVTKKLERLVRRLVRVLMHGRKKSSN